MAARADAAGADGRPRFRKLGAMTLRPARRHALAVLIATACVALAITACTDEAPTTDQSLDRSAPATPATPADNRLADTLLPAMDLVAAGRFDEAYDLATDYGEQPGALAYQAAFMRGYARHKAQRYAAARELFEEAVALAPDYHPSWHFLGFACHALGDLDRAAEAFAAHARLQPDEGDDAFGLGIVALARDELDEAERQLTRALTLHRRDAAAGRDRRRELARCHARLGDVHAARGDWAAARDALVQAVQRFAGHDEIWHKLSTAHRRLGEDELADQAAAARDQLRAGAASVEADR